MLRDLTLEEIIKIESFQLDLLIISTNIFKDCKILIAYLIIFMNYLESIFKF